MVSLSKNKDFENLLKGKKISNKYFTVFFSKLVDKKNNKLNVSFVTKKKIGNAVKRNKIKRKLKAAVVRVIKEKQSIDLNYTYVVFGRNNVYKDKFQLVFNEIKNVFKKINETRN